MLPGAILRPSATLAAGPGPLPCSLLLGAAAVGMMKVPLCWCCALPPSDLTYVIWQVSMLGFGLLQVPPASPGAQ